MWPQAFRDDLDKLTTQDRKHVFNMLKPKPFPDNHLEPNKLPKIVAMETAAQHIADIEDLDVSKIFYK